MLNKQGLVDTDAKAIRSTIRTALAAACVGLFAATGASAGTLVTMWDYRLDNAFTSFVEEVNLGGGSVTGTLPNSFVDGGGNPTKLEWPATAPSGANSFLQVGNPFPVGGPTTDNGVDTGTLTTDALPIDTVLISHGNFVQRLVGGQPQTALDSAVLKDVLRLMPVDGDFPGLPIAAPAITLNINFKETSNSGPHPADIFVIDIVGAMFDPLGQTFSQLLPFDDFLYEITIGLEGVVGGGNLSSNGTPALGVLTDEECTLAGAALDCIGLTTPEGGQSDFRAVLNIASLGGGETMVSEPTTLAVLGLGLIGLGAMRRRSRRAIR